MDTMHLKKLLDACFTAKHVIETMPELPTGMKPRHIHVLTGETLLRRLERSDSLIGVTRLRF